MWRVLLLLGHALLLILASTSFTVVMAWPDGPFSWEYFRYSTQSGWGTAFQFAYTLPVVLTYLAAYSTGLAGYLLVWRHGARNVGATGVALCTLGFASFAFELTHWVGEHGRSWIVSMPGALLLLAVAALVQQYRLKVQPTR